LRLDLAAEGGVGAADIGEFHAYAERGDGVARGAEGFDGADAGVEDVEAFGPLGREAVADVDEGVAAGAGANADGAGILEEGGVVTVRERGQYEDGALLGDAAGEVLGDEPVVVERKVGAVLF